LLGCMLAALRRRTLARFVLLILASLIAALFSFASLFVSLCFVHAIVLDAWTRRRTESRNLRALLPQLMAAGLFDLAVLALHHELLAGQSSDEMRWFWRNYFLHFDSVQAVLFWITRHFLPFPIRALSLPLIVLAPLLFVGAKVLLGDLELRPLVWAFFLLIAGLVVAAALDIYPMGAERIELFSYPLFWSIAAVGGDRLWRTRREHLRTALVAYVVLVCLARPAVSYSDVHDRQVVEETLRDRQPGDALLMQHTGLLAFAYYAGLPLRFEHYADVCHQFVAWPTIADLHVLPIKTNGQRLVEHPDAADRQLAQLYERGYPRIFYVSTHATDPVDQHIVEDAAHYGYRSRRIDESPRARLFILERVGASLGPLARSR
ncbi:MAG TPA: hypothetical protein VHZ95_22300, partial [Polyangiales bacterium]|nr:hypothetical protein [Polyangiales bacterium]